MVDKGNINTNAKYEKRSTNNRPIIINYEQISVIIHSFKHTFG
ncbi:hypothetical protein ADIS_2857 [Lunatimonas lonarensis]|uniref:Uncharacterized protein n=1 Tax=Lunatimonas lonarensis TaxID=1232681 RepID=R7ZQP7_9BACT|nr:hypothetical protein ADIS_2857 [Lunatimonas lonarensis]